MKLFRISAHGKEKVVEIIQAGHTFAEAVMFMQKQVYPVWAEALEPVRLAAVPSRLMLHCLQDHPQSRLHLLGHLSVRLHQRQMAAESAESAASYWHMVDLVWLMLFPLLYVLP